MYIYCACTNLTDVLQCDCEPNPAHLNNQDVLSGISNWKTEGLVPLRGSGPITHLQKQKPTCFHIRICATTTIKMVHFEPVGYLTVVLWDSFPRETSAPTFGSLPLFFSFQHKSRQQLKQMCSRNECFFI